VSRDCLLYLDDVIDSAENIQRFVRTATLDKFLADEMLFDAVLYNLQVIGCWRRSNLDPPGVNLQSAATDMSSAPGHCSRPSPVRTMPSQ
jgi:hypothetical protein